MTVPVIRDTGEGPALLLLHGYPLDSSQWDHQVAALSGDHRCLRPDFWGCGTSPTPPAEAGSLADYAETLLSELDRRSVDTFDVAGSSMGGYIALAMWRLAPARMRSLALVGSRATADSEAARADRRAIIEHVSADGVETLVEASVERLLCPTCQEEPHIADPLRGRVRRWTPAGVAAVLTAIAAREDSTPLLPTISIPTLVITGTRDALVPPEESRAMAAAIPGATLRELEGAGHLPNLEQPQLVSQLFAKFLGDPQNM